MPTIATLRIVYAALIFGCVVFAAVVFALTRAGGLGTGGAPALQTFGTIAAGLALPMVPVAFLTRGRAFARAAAAPGDGASVKSYTTGVLVFAALLEGALLLNLTAWLVSGDPLPNAAVALVLGAMMLTGFPSQARLDELRESARMSGS
jgi:hypothetical protein